MAPEYIGRNVAIASFRHFIFHFLNLLTIIAFLFFFLKFSIHYYDIFKISFKRNISIRSQWFSVPTDCSSELQRLLLTSKFTNTTPNATTDNTPTNVTVISNTIMNTINNTIKYQKGKGQIWNELQRRIRANRGENRTMDATTLQLPPGLWSGYVRKRKETQFRRKFDGKLRSASGNISSLQVWQ